MTVRHKSVPTLKAPEFINLDEDAINPGISKCEIKIFYLGENRNGTYFGKDVAVKMAQTLPGTVIVGAWYDDKDDFGDHGQVITIENGEVEFSCRTVPVGFVAPESKVWFQDFNDEDEFGNSTVHTYLMANGYLWTGQYPEVKSIIESGKGQSMELDGGSMEGHWATNSATNMDFFIVEDAEFTKLCVLGDDVEPCFEGASVTALSDLTTDFTVDDFKKNLHAMLKELTTIEFSLKGGVDMEEEKTEEIEETEFADKKDKDDDDTKPSDGDTGSDDSEDTDAEPAEDDDDDKKKPTKSTLQDEYDALNGRFADAQAAFDKLSSEYEDAKKDYEARIDALSEQVKELSEFKLARLDADKDAVIARYHMLSDEDKADVVAHKADYTAEEIDAKLALIYVNKNVDFDVDNADGVAVTYSVDGDESAVIDDSLDPILKALRESSGIE